MTPHIESKKEDIARIVLMPGDPKRAEYIAKNYLDNYQLVNTVRGILAYTGFYQGVRITVMAHGMGIPSLGIYCYELFKFYDVSAIIRIGSAGSLDQNVKINDLVLATSASSFSNYAYQFNKEEVHLTYPSKEINEVILRMANDTDNLKVGPILTSDIFDVYANIDHIINSFDEQFVAVEMEAFVLFYLANYLHKKAACLLTIVDSKYERINVTSEEREKNLNKMILLALKTAVKL